MQPLHSRYAVVSIKKLFDVKLGTFHVHGPATVKLNAFFGLRLMIVKMKQMKNVRREHADNDYILLYILRKPAARPG